VPRTASVNQTTEPEVDLRSRFFNVRTALSFVVGISILVALFRIVDVDPAELVAQIRGVNVGFYAIAIACYALTFPFRGLRWQRLLDNVGIKLPALPLTEVIFISWFVNSVLPGKIGDLYRGYIIKREHGVSLSRTVGTVVAERVMDLLCLILLLGSAGFLVLRNRESPVIDGILHLGWIGLAVMVIGLLVTYRFGERVMKVFPTKVQEIYQRFAHGTFSSFSLRSAPLLVILTVFAWSAEAARLYFVLRALDVPSVGPLAALFTVAAISLSLIIPTPGGLGGVEAAFVLVLAVFDVDRSLALAVAFLDRIISYYSLIVIGFPAFLITKRGR
jgi:glycosyltransferase 2 family protein